MPYASYEFYIDWDGDGGLRFADFEQGTEGFAGGGTTPPTFDQSSARAYSGTYSLLVSWTAYNPFTFDSTSRGFGAGRFGSTGFDVATNPFTFDDASKGFDNGVFGFSAAGDAVVQEPYLYKFLTGLTPGVEYDIKAYVYVPTGGRAVRMTVDGLASTSYTSSNDTWLLLSLSVVALYDTHTILFEPNGDPASGETFNIDSILITGEFEPVIPLSREDVSFDTGRDQSRSLNPIRAGESSIELLNQYGWYSPDNVDGPLVDKLRPGKEVLYRATYNGQLYNLWRGFLDDLKLHPEIEKQSVTLSLTDALATLGQIKLSTEVLTGKRTGELIDYVLDQVGWPEEKRDIDPGATIVQYWWEEDTDAADAIQKLVASEGPPALVMLSPAGDFMFHDRHHRLFQTRSTTVQATFNSDPLSAEPLHSRPFDHNVGWKDTINRVTFSVQQYSGAYDPAADGYSYPVVWETEDSFNVGTGETKTFDIVANDPFFLAQVPSANNTGELEALNDYDLVSGTISVTLSRTSGQRTQILVQNTGGSNAYVKGMRLRAIPLKRIDQAVVEIQDDAAIDAAGRVAQHDISAPWCNVNDATAIATGILSLRANRLPTVSITVNNGSTERLTNILSRAISDRVHIKEAGSFTDHDFIIESIEHHISEAGTYHEATFGCERVFSYGASLPFTFNDASKGFDNGVFGYSGIDDPSTVFILGTSLLGTGLLAL